MARLGPERRGAVAGEDLVAAPAVVGQHEKLSESLPVILRPWRCEVILSWRVGSPVVTFAVRPSRYLYGGLHGHSVALGVPPCADTHVVGTIVESPSSQPWARVKVIFDPSLVLPA
jgi:hypothetical protein